MDDLLVDEVADSLVAGIGGMLSGDDYAGNLYRLVVDVLYGDPTLGVGAEPLGLATLTELGQVSPSWCAYMIGAGINSGVSSQANPNIRP